MNNLRLRKIGERRSNRCILQEFLIVNLCFIKWRFQWRWDIYIYMIVHTANNVCTCYL